MSFWLWVLGSAYLVLLGVAAWRSYRRNQSADDYALAGSNVGVFLGFLTFSATLFSTFTLMGMPDFFRTHGVGAWIFLAVSDGAMVFLVVWFGFHLRRKVAEKGFQGMSGLMTACYGSRWAGYVFYAGVFLFLVPYVAIQVRGIAVFLNSAYPAALPAWAWASIIVIVMLIYSEIGGLKAIMYSDVMQGLLLLTMTWVIAVQCIDHFGGIRPMFDEVERVNEALLSVPGPNGLFGIPFLIASFFAILMIPVTQPQLTIRVVVMRNLRATHRMAVAVGFFAMIVILPTIAIGMYGAVRYPEAPAAAFWAQVLLFEQPGLVAAAVIVGLVAAAMSTADSQIFALGTELRSLLTGEERAVMRRTRIAIVVFAAAALVFSILSSDQLVALALKSFQGTSMLAPMVFAAVFSARTPGREVIALTALALLAYIASLLGWLPAAVATVPVELVILLAAALLTLVSVVVRQRQPVAAGPAPRS